MTIETRPLAERIRPDKIEDFYGLEILYEKYPFLKVMVEEKFYRSSIFYGPSGSGKTTFALLLIKNSELPVFELNAVSAKKSDLVEVVEHTKNGPVILLLDEIHRLNKDKQEILLPVIESGKVVLFGLTTVHPYSSLPASIRSRVHIYHFEENSLETIILSLKRALNEDVILSKYNRTLTDEAFNQIASSSSGDIRYAMNVLENVVLTTQKDEITVEDVVKNNATTHLAVDAVKNHYDLLSALQKSIRGSDVDAALYWLVRLAENQDVTEITRRLLVIAFEDISFGFPNATDRTVAACEAAEKVGFPEAIFPLSYAVAELSLAPKSKSIYYAISEIKKTIATTGNLPIPEILKLRTIDRKQYYDYGDPKSWECITYLPEEIKDASFFDFKLEHRSGKFEQQMEYRYNQLKEFQKKNRK